MQIIFNNRSIIVLSKQCTPLQSSPSNKLNINNLTDYYLDKYYAIEPDPFHLFNA